MIAPARRAIRRRQAIGLACIALTTTMISCAARKTSFNEPAKQAESSPIVTKGKNLEGCAKPHVEVLNDTKGADIGPYLTGVVDATRKRWYLLIPGSARFPKLKKGCVAIQFRIMPDGSVQKMQVVHRSGDVSLDRAAWAGILDAAPFPPLPKQYKEPSLALRFYFLYNKDTEESTPQ